MQFSRRLWGTLALIVLFAVATTALERPVFFFAAAGLLAWVLNQGYRFISAVRWLDGALEVEQTPTTPTFVEDERPFTLTATLPRSTDLRIRIEPQMPVAADTNTEPVQLGRGETRAEATGDLTWRIAGEYRLRPAAVTVSDRLELFSTSFRTGTTPTVRVDPPKPGDTYIAEGGANLLTTLGRRQSILRGNGFDLGEVREYVAGDPMTRVDWKATARLNGLHVRELEADSAVVTTMILDAREGMHVGPEGSTKFDYLRQVALALIGESREAGEPVGLYVLDDQGASGVPARATQQQYERLRERLYSIRSVSGAEGARRSRVHRRNRRSARRMARTLDDETPFSRTLRPFLLERESGVGVSDDPLYRLIRSGRTRTTLAGGGTVLTVLLTDDTNRAVLRECASLARRRDGQVLVFITPAALFEQNDPDATDAERTYERLREFDRFRRELSAIEGVTAFEVGPGHRLERVLREAEQRRQAMEVR